jgi:hypothetical protein
VHVLIASPTAKLHELRIHRVSLPIALAQLLPLFFLGFLYGSLCSFFRFFHQVVKKLMHLAGATKAQAAKVAKAAVHKAALVKGNK